MLNVKLRNSSRKESLFLRSLQLCNFMNIKTIVAKMFNENYFATIPAYLHETDEQKT